MSALLTMLVAAAVGAGEPCYVPAEQKLFTWWSYRNRDWRASNRGRRLDHIWTTPALDGAAVSMRVLDETRDWKRTSDHVPVVADFVVGE